MLSNSNSLLSASFLLVNKHIDSTKYRVDSQTYVLFTTYSFYLDLSSKSLHMEVESWQFALKWRHVKVVAGLGGAVPGLHGNILTISIWSSIC